MERGLGWRALVLVALAVIVAFSVVLTTTQRVEAQAAPDHTLANADNSVSDVAPGDTVRIEVTSAFAQVSITGTADGVGGSFAANDGQSISCGDGNTCDRDTDASEVAVDLTVDADSGEGFILLSVGGLGATTSTKVINVSKTNLVGSFEITASPTTIAAADGTSTLTILVKDAQTTPEGQNGESVTLVTTLGSIECVPGTETQACSVTTADSSGITGVTDGTPGYATVTLNGKGVEGQAVVTARIGTLTDSVTVTLFGTAKNLTAEPEQGSVEIGGSVFVVLTATDDAGNPVSGLQIAPVSDEEVVGPSDDAVLVATEKTTPAPATGDSLVGRGYSEDKPAVGDAAAIPACGDDNTDTDADTSGLQELFGPNDGTGDAGEGTNDKGQCVVYVTATEDTEDATKSATRGVHTLNFAIGDVKASATIEVAGSPHSITTDAPASVDPASVTEITVSVWDDTNVLVGITSVKVRKVDGGGLIEDQGEGGSEMTTNGQSKFTFIAPSSAGTAEILITVGDVSQRVAITIGEPEDTGPTVVELTDGPASTYVSWNDDWGTVSSSTFENVAGLVVVWKWTGTMWIGYVASPTAPAATKTNFTVSPGDVLYVVSNGAVTFTLY